MTCKQDRSRSRPLLNHNFFGRVDGETQMAACVKCAKPLPEAKHTGRPRVYCSMPCRRLGEAERRRLERELARLQARRSNVLAEPWGKPEWRQRDALRLDQVIVQIETRLRLLYAAGEG